MVRNKRGRFQDVLGIYTCRFVYHMTLTACAAYSDGFLHNPVVVIDVHGMSMLLHEGALDCVLFTCSCGFRLLIFTNKSFKS